MEKLTAKLVYVSPDGRQRYYQLNRKIVRGKYFGEEFDIPQRVVEEERFKDEYKFLVDLAKDGVDIICVSDAHTHIERLVFAGFEYNESGQKIYSRYSTVIDGENTFMIDGGDYDCVYEPGVYLRHLSKLNGYEFGGIVE